MIAASCRGHVSAGTLVACLAAAAGCSPEQKLPRSESVTNVYSVEPIPVTSSVLYESTDLAAPAEIAIVRDLLVVTDPYAAPHVLVIDKRSGRLVRAFGSTGEGPGEYRAPLAAVGDEVGNRVWIGDSPLGRLTEVSLDHIDAEGWQPVTRVIKLKEKTFLDVLLASGQDSSRVRFLAVDATGQSRFFEFDDRGKIVARLGSAVRQSEGISPEIAGRVFASVITLDRGDSIIAAAGVWTGTLVLYGRDGTLRDSIRTPIRFPPNWESSGTPDNPGMRATHETRKGYVDLATSGDQLIGVFSGRFLREYPQEASAGRDLHIFDGEGRLLRVYRLDRGVTSIAVDQDGQTLYGTHWGVRPAVLRIALPGE